MAWPGPPFQPTLQPGEGACGRGVAMRCRELPSRRGAVQGRAGEQVGGGRVAIRMLGGIGGRIR